MLYTNKYSLIDKVINQVLSRKNIIWSKFSPEKVCSFLYKDENISVAEFFDRLYGIIGKAQDESLSKIQQSEKEIIIDYANHTLKHEFDVLGSGWKKLDPIVWNWDFINNFRWDNNLFYKDYSIISPTGGRDIKIVWELSRCHHLLWLAEAYRISGDSKYAYEVITQISNWIDDNPLMYSVNWTCSMDVAIRAINWIYSLAIIGNPELIKAKFVQKIMNSLYKHVFFIINNLEKTIPNSGNHYLSDIVGLLFICPIFPKNKFARFCDKFAFNEFKREALIELNVDGSNYENSVSYHRLVTELFFYAHASLLRQGRQIPASVSERINAAIHFVKFCAKPNGKSPIIGDNDNGRLLPFVPRDFQDHLYLYDCGLQYFGENKFNNAGEYIFMGGGEYSIPNQNKNYEVSQSGIAKAKIGEAHLIVTNGGFSLGRCKKAGDFGGTHTHCDNLSFELTLGEDDVFIDPGSYVYTPKPEFRNIMRSSNSHNTLVIDDTNFAEYYPCVFTMRQNLFNIFLDRTTNSKGICIRGGFNFDNGKLFYIHNREFIIEEHSIKIIDNINIKNEHKAFLNFILPSNISINQESEELLIHTANYIISVSAAIAGKKMESIIEECPISPSYGKLKVGHKITFNGIINDISKIETIIKWEQK